MSILRGVVLAIDKINETLGKLGCWMILFMVLFTVIDVTARYLFNSGSIAFMELEWHLFAANFIIAAGWTMMNNQHVRVDIISLRFGPKTKAVIEILGALVFCLPFCVIVIWASWPFLMNSWSMGEGSPDPGGLPARYVLKAFIPVGFGLIALQAVAQIIKAFSSLKGDGGDSK